MAQTPPIIQQPDPIGSASPPPLDLTPWLPRLPRYAHTIEISSTEAVTEVGIIDVGQGGDIVIVGTESVTEVGDISVSVGIRIESTEALTNVGQITLVPASSKALFLIGGTDRTNKIHRASATTISETIDGGGSMTFHLVDPTYSYRPTAGEPVEFWLNSVKEFSGMVQAVNEGHAPRSDPTAPVGRPSVVCGDPAVRFNDLYIKNREFAETVTAREMWEAITAEILEVEGYSLATGLDPGVIEDRRFEGVTVADFSQRVNRASGWDSRVDYDRVIHFFNPSTGIEAAPFSLADNDNQISDPLVREHMGGFANVVHVRLSTPSGTPFTEFATKVPGSSSQSWGPWQLTSPITENAAISGVATGSVASVDPVTIITQAEYERRKALRPTNTGLWHFKYTPGTNILEHKQQNPVFFPGAPGYIGTPVSLAISYATGEAANQIITIEDATSIAARKAIEGGSGRHEYMEELHNIESVAAAEAIANGLLARKKNIPKEFAFTTDLAGFKPGQALTSTYTKPPATDTFLIQKVTKSSVGPSLDGGILATPFMRSRIESANGPLVESQQEILRRLIDRDRPNRTRSNDIPPFILGGSITGLTNDGLDSVVVPSGGGTVATSGLSVTGTDTTFETDLAVGDLIFVVDSFDPQLRVVDAIASDTRLTVTSAFSPDLTAAVYRTPLELGTKRQIVQKGSLIKVAAVFDEPPTGNTDATGPKRVVVDIQKNTTAAPTVFTSVIPGVTKLVHPSGLAANAPSAVNISVGALAGEVLRCIVLDANSDTPIRNGVCLVHQAV